MSYLPNLVRHTYAEVKVEHMGVPFVVKGVTFYPSLPSDGVSPPEPSFIDWDSIEIGGVDVSELCHGELGDDVEDAVIAKLEG